MLKWANNALNFFLTAKFMLFSPKNLAKFLLTPFSGVFATNFLVIPHVKKSFNLMHFDLQLQL